MMLKRKTESSQPDPNAPPEGSPEMTYLEITFAKVSIFSACTPDELMQLAGATSIRAAAPGEAVITEGEPDAREFFVILKGEAQVTRGKREVGALGPGDFFGELALFDPAPRNASVIAATELSLAVLSLPAFRAALAKAEFRDSVLAGMARRLHHLDSRY
jgi:CRP-like cAMP-binding protein